jgi:nitrate reductase gamma subunit
MIYVSYRLRHYREIHMYIGGILGTILLIALIVYVVRRV